VTPITLPGQADRRGPRPRPRLPRIQPLARPGPEERPRLGANRTTRCSPSTAKSPAACATTTPSPPPSPPPASASAIAGRKHCFPGIAWAQTTA